MKAILDDITKLDVGAIVNATNSSLLGRGCVDGAIHLAEGSEHVHKMQTPGRLQGGAG
jgi:O-acetyl-ADP-ribose deacetylase